MRARRCTRLLLFVGGLWVFLSGPSWAWQPGSDDCARCANMKSAPQPTYASFFRKQLPITAESREWKIEMTGEAESPECNPELRFRVTRKPGDAASDFTLCNDTVQVDEVDVIDGTKLLILGRAAANAPIATIVRLPGGGVVDHFPCFMPAVSPSHRFLAFVKAFPGHPGPMDISAEYIVYDLTLGPEYNRATLSVGVSDPGLIVYPPGASNLPGSNIVAQGTLHHSWASDKLFWLTPDRLAFADQFDHATKLVTADLSSGIKDFKIRALDLDPSEFVDLAQCKRSSPALDFQELSRNPAGVIRIHDIQEMGRVGSICVQFAQSPCLKHSACALNLAPVPAQQATNSPGDNLNAVFARMDKTSTEFRSAEANFEWDQYTRVIDETDKQEGKVYFRKTDKEVEMAAHVNVPPAGEKGDKKVAASSSTEKFVLFSGGKVQLYQPSTDHLDIYGTGKNNDAVESFLVLGFGGSSPDMLKAFDVTYGGHEKVDGADTDRLELVPRTEKVKSMFNHIELWIDSRGISVQQKLISPEGDYRLNKYSDVILNKKIPDSVFRLKTNGKTTIESH